MLRRWFTSVLDAIGTWLNGGDRRVEMPDWDEDTPVTTIRPIHIEEEHTPAETPSAKRERLKKLNGSKP